MKPVESFEQVKGEKRPYEMPKAVVFKDHKLEVAGLRLRAPLERAGYCQLFDDAHDLMHTDLTMVAAALGLPTHGLMPTHTLAQVVAGELIVAWHARMHGESKVPQLIHENHYHRVREYRFMVEKLNRGEELPMATKKAKGSKATPKAKVYKVVAYEVVGGKVESKDGKRYMEAENKSHNAVIYRALRATKEPLTFEQVMSAVGSKAFGSESKDVSNIYRWHLNDLRKRGLVRSTEEKVEAKSAEEARAGEGEPAQASA